MSRRVIIIAVGGTLGLIAVWYLALWSPQTTSLKAARASATATLQKQQDLKSQVATLQAKRAKLPALEAALAQVAGAVPKTADVDKLIDNVNAAAVNSSVVVQSFTPAQPSSGASAGTAGAGPEQIGLTMNVLGTYFQVVDFANRLTAMPRLVVIDGLGFGQPDKNNNMTVSITAHVFMLPPVSATPATTTTVKASK